MGRTEGSGSQRKCCHFELFWDCLKYLAFIEDLTTFFKLAENGHY